jgi:hypothetical protein
MPAILASEWSTSHYDYEGIWRIAAAPGLPRPQPRGVGEVSPVTRPTSIPRRFPTPMLCGLVAAIGFSVGACGSGAQTPPLAQPDSGRSSSSPSSSSSSAPSAASGNVHHRTRSVVVCPTDFSSTAPPPRRALYRPVRPPAGVKDAVVYTDSRGELRLVGPRGWRCKADFFQNLSAGLIVYPAGERIPRTWGAVWHVGQNSKSQAISIVEEGLSDAQGAGVACSYFPAARTAVLRDFGHGCAPPSTERVRRVDRRRVEFEDPAGAPGGGIPSGGRYPALGAVTYKASATPTTYLTSCTVAKRISKICAADLNRRRDP